MTIEKLWKYGISDDTIETLKNIREIYNEKYNLLNKLKSLSNREQACLLMDLIYNSIVFIIRQEILFDSCETIEEMLFETESALIAEKFLEKAIYSLLISNEIKQPLRNKIPELYESVYEIVDLEKEIDDELLVQFTQFTNVPSQDEVCNIINETIKYVIANAENLKEDIKTFSFYEDFEKIRKKNDKYDKYREEF